MKNEPDIARQLIDAEKFGQFEGKISGSYEQLESSESLSEDVSDETADFGKDDRIRKEGGAVDNQGNKLQQDLTKLRLIISSMDDFVFVLDKNGIFTDYFQSNKIAELYVPPEKFIGKSFREILPPHVVKLFDDAINTMLTNNSPQQFDYCLELRNSVRWFNAKISMWRDNSDRFLGTVAVVRDVTERKQVEEALKASEEKLRIIFESITDAVIVTDMHGKIVQLNNATTQMTGYSKEELFGKDGFTLIAPEYHALAMKIMDEILKSRKAIQNIELKFLRADGTHIDAEFSTAMLRDNSMNPVGFISISKDITERKQVEKALIDAKERWLSLTTNTDDIIILADKEGTIQYINRTIPPHTIEKTIGTSLYEYIPEEQKTKMVDSIQKVFKTGEISSYEVSTSVPTFGTIWFTTKVIPIISDEKISGVILISTDITKRKLLERENEENMERLFTVIERVGEGITFSDKAGHFDVFNSKMQEITGYTMNEANDCKDFTILIYPDPNERQRALEGLTEIIEKGTPREIEAIIRTKDGKKKILMVSTSLVSYKNNDMFLSVYQDITERKRAQEKLREKEERYHALYEGIRDGYVMTSMDGKIIEYNSFFRNMLGYTDEELQGKIYTELIPKEWQSRVDTMMEEQVLKKGYSDIFEKEFIKKDGRIIPVEGRKYLLKKEGKPVGMWSFVRDITDRKQTETELMKKMNALEKYKNITIGRELKMIELKKQIKELEEKLKNTR